MLLLISPATYRTEAFLSAAQRLNIDVIVGVDLPEKLADHWHVPLRIDFTDVEASVRHIVAYAQEQPLAAILSLDDSAIELAAMANAALGLSHNSLQAAEASRDKFKMRTFMSAGGVPGPVFRPFALSDDPAWIAEQVTYPCVVKPTRLSGSRGVIRANHPAEFLSAFTRVKRMLLADGNHEQETQILVEDFMPGFEVALEGLLTHGKLQVLALFDKPDPLDGPFFEETLYITPSRLSQELQTCIADCVTRAAASLHLHEGPVHAELRVNERGLYEQPVAIQPGNDDAAGALREQGCKVAMLEIAGRSIGGLCSTILEFGSGMCLEELILLHATGEQAQAVQRDVYAAGVMMIPIPSAGILKAVHGVEEAKSVPFITGVEITAQLHYPLTPLPEGASYLGFIFARGQTSSEVEAALRLSHQCLRFDIRRELPIMAVSGKEPAMIG